MRGFLLIDGEPRREFKVPEDYVTTAEVDGGCPLCGEPLIIYGKGKRISQDDRAYEADGFCHTCEECIGVICVEVPTLFGLREDAAVLEGRCRVYWRRVRDGPECD